MQKPNTSTVIVVTQTRVKQGKDNEFVLWQNSIGKAAAQFPGYLSYSITPSNPPVQEDWVIMQRFASADQARTWLNSTERHQLLEKAKDFLTGFENVYLLDEKENKRAIVATISAQIDPKDEQRFLEWHTRIQKAQSQFPGFIACRLEPPQAGIHDSWVSILTFDSDAHLEEWLQSPERKKLIDELNTFSSASTIRKVYAGFDFWFKTGTNRSIWKESMLVLLTLYPVVFLLSYIQNPVMAQGVPFWLALFFGNAASTVILGYVTTPWLMQTFGWWLNPHKRLEQKHTILGTVIVIALYCMSLLICWQLFIHWPP